MRRFAVAIAFVATTLSMSAFGQTVTFNFDTAPGGASIPNGTAINSTYASQGLTLSRTATGTLCNDGNIYANSNRPSDFTISSPPNVVSTCPGNTASDISEPLFGAIRADLASTASQVCINVRPDTSTDQAILRAYDAGANLLTSATSTAGVIQTLCVSATGIRRVEFSGAGTSFARFDDLAVTFGAAPPTPSVSAPVPTTSDWVLIVIALSLIATAGVALRRRP